MAAGPGRQHWSKTLHCRAGRRARRRQKQRGCSCSGRVLNARALDALPRPSCPPRCPLTAPAVHQVLSIDEGINGARLRCYRHASLLRLCILDAFGHQAGESRRHGQHARIAARRRLLLLRRRRRQRCVLACPSGGRGGWGAGVPRGSCKLQAAARRGARQGVEPHPLPHLDAAGGADLQQRRGRAEGVRSGGPHRVWVGLPLHCTVPALTHAGGRPTNGHCLWPWASKNSAGHHRMLCARADTYPHAAVALAHVRGDAGQQIPVLVAAGVVTVDAEMSAGVGGGGRRSTTGDRS